MNDPNDASLRVMAVEADRLVTGNHHAGLLQHGILGRTRIVTPATFCAEALRCLAKSFLWTKARQSGKRPLLSGPDVSHSAGSGPHGTRAGPDLPSHHGRLKRRTLGKPESDSEADRREPPRKSLRIRGSLDGNAERNSPEALHRVLGRPRLPSAALSGQQPHPPLPAPQDGSNLPPGNLILGGKRRSSDGPGTPGHPLKPSRSSSVGPILRTPEGTLWCRPDETCRIRLLSTDALIHDWGAWVRNCRKILFDNCKYTGYDFLVIKTFRRKGIEEFFLTGSKAGIQASHERRLRLQLTRLDVSRKQEDMNASGWRLHPLKGALQGFWAVWVDGNVWLIFRFEERMFLTSTIGMTIEGGKDQ